MFHGLRGSSRLVRRFPALWITLVLAMALVAITVPRRQKAVRTATEAWIPMRNLTPPEAAVLLEHGKPLARIGADTVDLVTDVYLVPMPSSEPGDDLVRRGGKTWQTVAAGWNGYSLSYRLDRAPLERELGGRPLAAFLDPKARAVPLSFQSERLPLYAAFEVVLLWVTLLLLWLIVRFLRPRLLIAPALLLLTSGFIKLINGYAPALFDADFFFQRWAVEPAALVFAGLWLPLLWASAFSLLSLLALLILRQARRGEERPAGRAAAAWAPLVLLLVTGSAAHWRATAQERHALDTMTGALHFDDAETVLGEARSLHRQTGNNVKLDLAHLPPHLRRFVTDAFAGMPTVPEGGSQVLLPIEGEDYLFLWRRPTFTFMDFRQPVSQIGQPEIDIMRETHKPYASGFFAQVHDLALRGTADRFNGRPLLDGNGRLRALVYVERSVRPMSWQ